MLESIEDLNGIFSDHSEAVRGLRTRRPERALSFFRHRHLPFLILYPLFALLCPYSWIFGSVSVKKHVIFPLVIACGFLLLASIYDKLLEQLKGKENVIAVKNGSLFLFLPVSAVGCFYVIHPLIGLGMTFAAGIYASLLSVETQARIYQMSLARSASYLISAGVLLLIPVLILLTLMNFMRSIGIVLDFFG